MGKVKRSQFATFINVAPTSTASYKLLGLGITNAKIEYNPEVSEEKYIHQDSGVSEVESYQPKMPIEITPDTDDDAFAFLDSLRKSRAVLTDARTNILNVWYYEGDTLGEYPAESQPVSVQVDDFGGEGGTSLKGNFSLNYIGAPTLGTYNPTTETFTPNP